MKKLLTILLVLILGAATADANVYTWSRYDLNFEVPEGGYVPFSDNVYFEMHWDDMLLTARIYRKEADNDKKKFYRENLQRKALSYSMYDLDFCKIKVKDFNTHAIEGTMPDGTRAIIIDMVSKKSDIIVEVSVNYLLGNREVVEDIIKSFAINKDKKPATRGKKKQKVQKKDDPKRQEQHPKPPTGPVFEI